MKVCYNNNIKERYFEIKLKRTIEKMKELYGIGNGTICVKGYKHKIVVKISKNNGDNWYEIAVFKEYGSRKRVREIFEEFTR